MLAKRAVLAALLACVAINFANGDKGVLTTSPFVLWSNVAYISDVPSWQTASVVERDEVADLLHSLIPAHQGPHVDLANGQLQVSQKSKWTTGEAVAPHIMVVAIVPELRSDTFSRFSSAFEYVKTATTRATSSLFLNNVLEDTDSWSDIVNIAGANVVRLSKPTDFKPTVIQAGVTNIVVLPLPAASTEAGCAAADAAIKSVVSAAEKVAEGAVVAVLAGQAAPAPYIMDFSVFATRAAVITQVEQPVGVPANYTGNLVPLNWTTGIWQGILVVPIVFTIIIIAACCLCNMKSISDYEPPSGMVQKGGASS